MGVINRTTTNLNNHTRSTLILTAPEPIIGDNTWRSPELNVAELDPSLTENISYVGGSAVYIGTESVQILITSTVATVGNSANTDVFLTAGKNGSPELSQQIDHRLTTANDVKELTTQTVITLENGDTFDFFIKASSDITINKAVWTIRRYDD